jgi:hypothetical protein
VNGVTVGGGNGVLVGLIFEGDSVLVGVLVWYWFRTTPLVMVGEGACWLGGGEQAVIRNAIKINMAVIKKINPLKSNLLKKSIGQLYLPF